MATRSLSLQWVTGDAEKAESSFFKINTQGTPLDDTEEMLLRNRKRSIAIAARSILRAGTGHKYWSKFPAETISKVEVQAKELHSVFFNPEAENPIKTLDLPIGGTKSPIYALDLLMRLIGVTNAKDGASRLEVSAFEEDADGSLTLEVLKKCLVISSRISGNDAGSLGLHPAVYFYTEKGRHLPDLILGMLLLVRRKIESNDKGFFKTFTKNRKQIEDYLIENKSIITQALQIARSKTRFERSADLFERLVKTFDAGKKFTDEDIVQTIAPGSISKILAVQQSAGSSKFSDDTKSAIFIRDSLKTALVCPICHGLLDPSKSASYDHVTRVREGGVGSVDNGKITHPYCNSGYKN